MKKINYLIILLLLMMFPLCVDARTYYPSGTDLNISIDDTSWYVFTRDNIYNNSELDDIGVTYDYMNNFMTNNDVYLDAVLFDENDNNDTIEFFIRIKELDSEVGNLHTYSETEIKKVGKSLINSEKINADDYEIYGDKYKYIVLEYQDSGYNIYQYYTTINGRGYNFTMQKVNSISWADTVIIEKIIDSIEFEIDDYYEQPLGSNNGSSTLDKAIEKGIIGAITAAIVSGLAALVNKNKDKNEKDNSRNTKVTNNSINTIKSDKNSVWKIVGIIALSFISSEMLLMILLGDSVDGTLALILVAIVTIPFYFLYNSLFKKKNNNTEQKVQYNYVEENIKLKKTKQTNYNDITICECGCKVLNSLEKCPKCGKKMK